MRIELSQETYLRLGKHVIGFETPDNVICRLLDFYESRTVTEKPELVFIPSEDEFRQCLINQKQAWKVFQYADGRVSTEEWSAQQFGEHSNLKSNIWSGALRGWKNKGIVRLTLTTEKPDIESFRFLKHEGEVDMVELRVGKLVKEHIDAIIGLCSQTADHLELLKNLDWCKEHFGISFPLIMISTEASKNYHERYWVKEYTINGQAYRFCSQFGGSNAVGTKTLSEYHGEKFLAYLKSFKLLKPAYTDKQIRFIVKS
ncbi:TPA: hypothetical protein NJ372_003533 [Vibrio parahaemolyticus]|jgi:hypothetical protein|uniref:hypothetical protein n=1 Tax=Vibrio parahaemolyticus TaxID=670 RepID=UPI0022B5999A|nr:hypothetical protein [Vibrio parahaemolyticus]MCZ6382429.1 hypothetical protein [Vibrio parahaemolyticus]HCG7256490.1 hypothetical protein [Vibrio parahaemolyticus]